MAGSNELATADYAKLLAELQAEVRSSRVKAARLVNTALIELYWKIGRHLNNAVASQPWGGKAFDQLADDLRVSFPEMSGLSRRNLFYMRKLAAEWLDGIVQQPAAQLGWGQIMLLLDKLETTEQRNWYAAHAAAEGWSRDELSGQIRSRAYERNGKALTNFDRTLPPDDSALAQETLKSEYMFDFLNLTEASKEKEVEDGLIANIEQTLRELGPQFAFVGRQYRFEVVDEVTGDSEEYKIDLLFFNMKLNAYVVIELKIGHFRPGYASQLGMYVAWVDENLRTSVHGQTVGLLLCAEGNRSSIRYTLASMAQSVGVSTYRREDLTAVQQATLPTSEDLTRALLSPVAQASALD